jgi:hypothetical protein
VHFHSSFQRYLQAPTTGSVSGKPSHAAITDSLLKSPLQANGIQTPSHAAIQGRSFQSPLQNDGEVQGSDDEVLMIGDTTNANYATTTCGISYLNKFDNWTQINALLHK